MIPIVEQENQTFLYQKEKKKERKEYHFIYVKFHKMKNLLYGLGSQISGYPL